MRDATDSNGACSIANGREHVGAQPSPAQPSPAQPSPAQPSPAQPSPAQPSPAQHDLTDAGKADSLTCSSTSFERKSVRLNSADECSSVCVSIFSVYMLRCARCNTLQTTARLLLFVYQPNQAVAAAAAAAEVAAAQVGGSVPCRRKCSSTPSRRETSGRSKSAAAPAHTATSSWAFRALPATSAARPHSSR
jgi:hypothetical protein